MAFLITLQLSGNINFSLQVGDQVYHTLTSQLGGFHQNPNIQQTHIGEVIAIYPNSIQVLSEHDDGVGNPLPGIEPPDGAFISFSKNRIVNNSDLLGYYASAQFVNDSQFDAKLFMVGSEVSENSK